MNWRALTLAALCAGIALWLLDVAVVRVAHLRDPLYWSALALFAAGLLGGSYVRRNDPRISRSEDGKGLTLGIRSTLGLTRDDQNEGPF